MHPLEKRYLDLFFHRQRKQWENYASSEDHDLSEIDRRIFSLLQQHRCRHPFSGRKRRIWRSIAHRGLVDKHPAVTKLLNRLDLGNREEHYGRAGMSDVELARRMQPDVLALMHRRNELSFQLGHSSYPHLVFFSEEMSLPRVKAQVEEYVEEHLVRVRRFVSSHNVRWQSWFGDLRRLGEGELGFEPKQIQQRLMKKLGLFHLGDNITTSVKESGFGLCRPVKIPDDIRILLKDDTSLMGLATLCHETGHALPHSANCTEGLFKTFPQIHDEALAVILEEIGLYILLEGQQLELARQINLAENVRCGLSCLFEFELWDHPDQAEELYRHHFGRLGVEIEDPAVWTLDTFRTLDPVYNHNYVLGGEYALKVLHYLQSRWGESHQDWGRWLENKLYSPGRMRPLKTKLASALGR